VRDDGPAHPEDDREHEEQGLELDDLEAGENDEHEVDEEGRYRNDEAPAASLSGYAAALLEKRLRRLVRWAGSRAVDGAPA
jgi:hypothetical protein